MNPLYPVLLGINTKVCDDVLDGVISLSPAIAQSVQSVLIVLFMLTAQNDFYFSLSCFVLTLFNVGIDQPFWKSLIPVAAITTLLYFPMAGDHAFLKIILTFIALGALLVGMVFEERLFPEEVSKEKIVFRVILVLGMIGFYFSPIMDWLPSYSKEPIQKSILIMISYLCMSVATMTYLMYSNKVQKATN
jgi:hypothetical protein